MDFARSVSACEPIQATSSKRRSMTKVGISASSSLQIDHPPVTRFPALDQRRHLWLMLVEGHGRCRVIHVPAEAAVVEIDDLHGLAVDQQIGQPQIAMDEAEALRPLAVCCKPLADEVHRAAEKLFLLGIDAHAVTPAAPMRIAVAEARLEIPGQPREPGRPFPLPRMQVHPRRHFAQHLEGTREILADTGLRARLPAEQHDVARPRHARVRHLLDDLAVLALDGRGRRHHAGLPQVDQPGKLRGDGSLGMIAVAMDAQRPAPPVGCFHLVGGVLREVDHLHVEAGGKIVLRGGGNRQFEEQRQLLFVGRGNRSPSWHPFRHCDLQFLPERARSPQAPAPRPPYVRTCRAGPRRRSSGRPQG